MRSIPAATQPVSRPRRIALLLPLSGNQRAVAGALRDGFLAAYFAAAADPAKPSIQVLDEEAGGAAAAYQQAIDNGADLIVGPLLKPSVTAVLPLAGRVTTLALNQIDAGMEIPAGFYQFALAPEDEAVAVAAHATAMGHRRALVLAPDTDWGRRMLSAFIPAVEARGGSVRAYHFYDPLDTDFTADIERLLLLDESRERHHALTANLGIAPGFEPRRRGDIDFIFLAASTGSGRLLRPQLRFLYAGDIPTYATSAIHTAGSSGDMDLDGVMFTDAPVLLGADPRARQLRATLAARWGDGVVGLLRFHAMGFDAWALANALGSGGAPVIDGLTGRLSPDPERRFHRETIWAEYRDGSIVPLPSP